MIRGLAVYALLIAVPWLAVVGVVALCGVRV